MGSLTAVNKLIGLLTEDEEIQSFYSDKLNWAISRKNDWEQDKVRVGIIGVTSSGKSTLINALLATNVLSSAIAPSSGQLVCCSYGEKYFAKIEFDDDKESVILEDESFTPEQLMEYSDERKNSKNKKSVKSIEIFSPNFDLGKDVLIIDSPGLEAYGLEVHEKITLETLVPTIDVCVYVSTIKTNSDVKAKDVLNVVARYGCPTVMVQNMLDSVKPSPSGDRTAEENAKGYYNRIRKIVDSSEIRNKDDVEIVQISAEYARRWRLKEQDIEVNDVSAEEFEKSNYKQLISVIGGFIENQKPIIEINRIDNLIDVIKDIRQINNSKTSGISLVDEEKKDYASIKKRIKRIDSSAENKLKKTITNMVDISSEIINDVDKATKNNIEEYVKETNQLVNESGNAIRDTIEKSNSNLIEIGKQLNIPTRDLMRTPSLRNYRNIEVEKRKNRFGYKVKQSGVKGWFRRVRGFFSGDDNLGYDYEYKEEITVDLAKTKQNVKLRLEKTMEHFESVHNKWYIDSLTNTCNLLLDEVSEYEELERKREEAVIQFNKIKEFDKNLNKLVNKISKERGKYKVKQYKKNEYTSVSGEQTSIDVDSYIIPLYDIANRVCRNQHIMIMKEYITNNNLDNYSPIMIGWDDDCIDVLKWQSGITDFIIFKQPDDEIVVDSIKGPKCYFVLVNAIQMGAAEKQIRNLKLEDCIEDNDYIIWVLQDLTELINANNIEEGLQRLISFRDNYMNGVNSCIWLLHNNPLYNLCLLECQNRDKMSLKEESLFLNEIKEEYSEYYNDEVIRDLSIILRSMAG